MEPGRNRLHHVTQSNWLRLGSGSSEFSGRWTKLLKWPVSSIHQPSNPYYLIRERRWYYCRANKAARDAHSHGIWIGCYDPGRSLYQFQFLRSRCLPSWLFIQKGNCRRELRSEVKTLRSATWKDIVRSSDLIKTFVGMTCYCRCVSGSSYWTQNWYFVSHSGKYRCLQIWGSGFGVRYCKTLVYLPL